MKTNFTGFLWLMGLLNLSANAQDLISCTNCFITPNYTFNSTTNEVTIVDMVIKNNGWNNAAAFDFAVFLKNVGTGALYEIDRVNYTGLSYPTGQNQIPITNMVIDLDNEPQVPSGTYRLEGRINDNQSAFETNYTNNTEYFGNQSFAYTVSGSGITEYSINTTIYVYPNPSNGKFTVQMTDGTTQITKGVINIYNIAGENIFSTLNAQSQMSKEIDIPTQPNGVYFLQMKSEVGISTKKIVIQK